MFDKEAAKSFGRRIAQRAKEISLSLRQVAQKADIDPSFLTRIATGERNPPSDEIITRLADVLDMRVDILLIEAGRIPHSVNSGSRSALPDFFRATEGMSEDAVRSLIRAIEAFQGGEIDKNEK